MSNSEKLFVRCSITSIRTVRYFLAGFTNDGIDSRVVVREFDDDFAFEINGSASDLRFIQDGLSRISPVVCSRSLDALYELS